MLIGCTWNIVCNNACCSNTKGGSHTPSGDTWSHTLSGQAPDTIVGQEPLNRDHHNDNSGKSGIGTTSEGRDDNGTTHIYSRATYHHSAVPYSNIVDGVADNYPLATPASPLGNGATAEEDGVRGNGNNPSDAWNYPIYGYPLCNLRLEDSIKIEAYENVAVAGFGMSGFDNNSAKECFPFSTKTKEDSEREQKWIRMPYPGNNPGYNNFFTTGAMVNVNHYYNNSGPHQFPLDSSWSLSNCDRLEDTKTGDDSTADINSNKRGRITAYYLSFKETLTMHLVLLLIKYMNLPITVFLN